MDMEEFQSNNVSMKRKATLRRASEIRKGASIFEKGWQIVFF